MSGAGNGYSHTAKAMDYMEKKGDDNGETEVRDVEDRERVRLLSLEGEVLNTRKDPTPVKGVSSEQCMEKEMLLSLAYLLLNGITFKDPMLCHPGLVKHIASAYGLFPSHLPVSCLRNRHRLALYNVLRMKYLQC